MKAIHFRSDAKMVDLLEGNYPLLQILDRLGISFGFGDKSVEELCRENQISLPFFELMFSILSHKEYRPSAEEIAACPPNNLLYYLKKSHEYYLQYGLPRIEELLSKLVSTWDSVTAKVVWTFFEGYEKEVTEHLAYEDEVVFPYVQRLIEGADSSTYSILEFEEKHDDIESKVKDLINILVKYIPGMDDVHKRNEVLLQLYLLEEDLRKHLQVENNILIPVTILLEKKRG